MNAQEHNILKRYYRGETTLEEERMLKTSFRSGNLPDDPMLAFQARKEELPMGLTEKIQTRIHSQRNRRITPIGHSGQYCCPASIVFFYPKLNTTFSKHLSAIIRQPEKTTL